MLIVLSLVGLQGVLGDITGTNPSAGTCLCFSENSVNVRSTACGTVIGSANAGNCFKAKGQKQACTLNGVNYEFFAFDYGGRDGCLLVPTSTLPQLHLAALVAGRVTLARSLTRACASMRRPRQLRMTVGTVAVATLARVVSVWLM